MEKEEFLKGWEHFCKCINFGMSALDADAIRFMNEFRPNLDSIIKENRSDE